MEEIIKAIQYHNLDEARKVLTEVGCSLELFEDEGGEEPQGLLSIVPEDRLPETEFYRLFDSGKGILVEVEKIPYSGYGAPAEEIAYMGFMTERTAYVLKGCHLPIEIEKCSYRARDIHHLEAMVLDEEHPIDRDALAQTLNLPQSWDFDHLFELICAGECNAEELDGLIHKSIH